MKNGKNYIRGMEIELEITNRDFNRALGSLTFDNADGVILNVGRPSDILLSTGMADKNMRLYGNKVMKKVRKHGFDHRGLKDLPKAMSKPIAVFEGARDSSHAILTELKIDGDNILVSLEVGKGMDIDFNIITSTYPKSGNKVVEWINCCKLLYADKEKALDYLRTLAPIASAADNQGHKTSLKAVIDFVNPELPTK